MTISKIIKKLESAERGWNCAAGLLRSPEEANYKGTSIGIRIAINVLTEFNIEQEGHCKPCGTTRGEKCLDSNIEKYQAGVSSIQAKMLSDRPTLKAYLRRSAESAGCASGDWKEEGCIEQAAHRLGMWHAYRDIERMLENDGFKPEEETEVLL